MKGFVREQALVSILAIVCELPQPVCIDLVDLLSHRLRSQSRVGRGWSQAGMRTAAHRGEKVQEVEI